MPSVHPMELCRGALRWTDRRNSLVVGGGASTASRALPSFLQCGMFLPRGTRISLSHLIHGPDCYSMHPAARARASALIHAGAGRRTIATYSHYPNNDSWNDDLRTILLKMYRRFELMIAENHASAMLYIKKSKSELARDIHKSFHDTTWRWFGSLTAGVSASVSLSYILYEKRSKMTEEHVNRRIDIQDKEIQLLRMENSKHVENQTGNKTDILTTVCADEIGKGFFVIVNDAPCQVVELFFEKDAIRFLCTDIVTGKNLELIVPPDYMMKVPVVKCEECPVVYTYPDAPYMTVVFEATGEQKNVKVRPEVINSLSGSGKVYAKVVTVLGRHIATSVREITEDPNYWSLGRWIGRVLSRSD